MLFVALVVMAFLVITAFLLDIAGGLMLHHRLQSMADQGADAGMNELSDFIVEKAKAREPNAPDGTDPRTVLTDEDRQAILVEGRARIEPVVREYIGKNPLPDAVVLQSKDVQFPVKQQVDCAEPDQQQVELRVTLKATQPMLFEKIWNRANTDLQASSWQTMKLCP